MKLKKPGTKASAYSVQKGNRIEYIHAGVKYVGTVIKPFPETREIQVQPDGLDVLHMVEEGKARRIRATKRYRSIEYAIRNNIPFMD